jgi:tetratricopeptide (TPR) repeat protein
LRSYPSEPNTIKLYIQRGLAREKINDRNGAIDDFSQYIWYSNYNAPGFQDRRLLAQAYYQRGELKLAMAKEQNQLKLLQDAQADFQQAFKYNPHESEVYFNLAIIASLLNHQSLALDYYQSFIGYETENYRGYYHRGQLYSRLGNYPAAIKDYNLAIFYQPDLIEGYYYRAIALEKIGGKRDAFKDYKIVLKCSPNLFLAKNAPSSYQNRARVQIEIADEEVELANLSNNSSQGYQTAI